MTGGVIINKALGKIINKYSYLYYCFLSIFVIGMEKYTSAKSIAVYHVPEILLTYSSNSMAKQL